MSQTELFCHVDKNNEPIKNVKTSYLLFGFAPSSVTIRHRNVVQANVNKKVVFC